MRPMPSRRRLLAAIGSTAAVGVAGCSGRDSGGPETVDCQTEALAHGDGTVLDGGATATVDGDEVRLAVPLSVEEVRERNVDSLALYDADGDLAHSIPVSADDATRMASKTGVGEGKLRYEQYLGQRPFHGQYRVVAVDDSDDAVDSVTVAFNCFPDTG